MRLLLDTCTFIWLVQDPGRLSAAATEAIDEPENDLFLSHASIWEVYNKCASGKLRLPEPSRAWVTAQLAARDVADWPIDLASLDRMSELPLHHRDPFDRMLAAQALVHSFKLLSPDPCFRSYGLDPIW